MFAVYVYQKCDILSQESRHYIVATYYNLDVTEMVIVYLLSLDLTAWSLASSVRTCRGFSISTYLVE